MLIIIIIMTMFCYGNSKSMIRAACYKVGKPMMTSLIIINKMFICFSEDEVGRSCVRLYAK